MAKDPRIWAGTPISLPDVSHIHIRCDDLPVPSSMSVYDPSIEYGIQCSVPQKSSFNKRRSPYSSSQRQPFDTPFIVNHSEIMIDGKWERTYTQPEVKGTSQTQILSVADTTINGRGWYLKFWIPIPARLFLKRETRIFEIRASVGMMGDEKRFLNLIESDGEEGDFPLVAETEMTVSHLRREREMITH